MQTSSELWNNWLRPSGKRDCLSNPIVENSKFTGYVDIVTMKAKKFDKDKLVDTDIPSELNNQAQEIRNA